MIFMLYVIYMTESIILIDVDNVARGEKTECLMSIVESIQGLCGRIHLVAKRVDVFGRSSRSNLQLAVQKRLNGALKEKVRFIWVTSGHLDPSYHSPDHHYKDGWDDTYCLWSLHSDRNVIGIVTGDRFYNIKDQFFGFVRITYMMDSGATKTLHRPPDPNCLRATRKCDKKHPCIVTRKHLFCTPGAPASGGRAAPHPGPL